MLADGVLAFASRISPLSLVLLAACGGDPAGGGSGGGDAGGGGGGVTSTVAGPVAVSSSATATATTGGGSPASSSSGGGGDGGAGGGPTLVCTDAPLPGAGGCTGDDPAAAIPDDCSTSANEGCTARTLCEGGGSAFPVPAGPGVAFGWHAGGVGTVDGDLAFTELLGDAYLLGTSDDGRAVVDRIGGSGELLIVDADGEVGPTWAVGSNSTIDHAAVTADGTIVVTTSRPQFLSLAGLELEGEGQVALIGLTGSGGIRWGRRLGVLADGFGQVELRGITAIDGDVVIVGQYEGELDLGGVLLPPTLPAGDNGYVARIDGATGDVVWAEVVGLPFGGTANVVTTTADGDLLVGGAVHAGEMLSTAGSRALLTRWTGDGDLVWATRTEASDIGSTRQAFDGVAETSSGAIVAVGFFTGLLRAGDEEVVAGGVFAPDAMVLSLDAEGAFTSMRTWSGRLLDQPDVETDDRAWRVSAFCDRVVVQGDLDQRSRTVIGGHVLDHPGDGFMSVVLELPAEGSWGEGGGGGGDVCTDADAFCEARVERSITCGIPDGAEACAEDEPCLGAMLREDVACDVRTCEAGAACDVDCDDVGLDAVLTATGAAFEAACEAAIGDGCGEDLPVGTCARMAHRQSDAYLEALLPCVTPARSCVSTSMCLRVVEAEWKGNPAGCGPEPVADAAICADDVALCADIAERAVSCEGSFTVSQVSDTADECLARRAPFDATYRDEVECMLEACFAGAPCHLDCRDRVVLAPPSALGEALIEGCLLVGSCADLFTGECAMIAHAWPDERIEAVLPCFDGSLSCDDAADCLGDVGANTWYP